MNLGIFQEKKITNGIYTCSLEGYSVFAMDAPRRHPVGVAILYCRSPYVAVEAVQTFGPNVFGFQLEMGER